MKKAAHGKKEPLFYENGIPIYPTNPVLISFRHSQYRHMVRQMLATNISMAQLVRFMMGPCQKCGHDKVELTLCPMPTKTQRGPWLPDFHKNNHEDDGQNSCDHSQT